MNPEKIRVLMYAIEKGSLSKAGEDLGYTPSGVSRMMVSMEEETGFPLLDRKKSGVTPTPECEKLIPVMKELVYWDDMYAQEASAVMGLQTGTVNVGITYTRFYDWLSRVIRDFNMKYPGIEVKTVDDSSTNLVNKMNVKEIDLCVVSKRPGNYRWYPMINDPLVAWVPKGHAAIEKGVYNIKGFEEEPCISLFGRGDTDGLLAMKEMGIKPNICYETKDRYAISCMVEAGLGVALMNNIEMGDWEKEVVALPLEPERNIEIGIMARADDTISPAAERFIKFAIENRQYEEMK